MLPLDILGGPAGGRVDQTLLDRDHLTIVLTTTAPTAPCPLCGSETRRVHSRYARRLADRPCFDRPVRWHVIVRRFRCLRPECPRRIFTERLLGFAAPYARTTDRLRQAHTAIGSIAGGEAGARLTLRLAMPTSPDTLLRRVKQIDNGLAPPPQCVGIDDWAWRKGQRYGTIVVDLERSEVIDLLSDRDADTVAKWLKAHPDIKLVSRDRSPTYAQAATEGAPQAQQVADRWHLLKNVREAIERLFQRQSSVINPALQAIEQPAEAASTPSASEAAAAPTLVEPSALTPSVSEAAVAVPPFEEPSVPPEPLSQPVVESPRIQAQRARRQQRVERFELVHERHRQGQSIRRIAREMGMSREAVRDYLRRTECPDWRPGRSRRSRLDEYREAMDAYLAEGQTNAAELDRRLREQGFRGSYGSVRRYVTKRLGVAGKKRERANAAQPPKVPPPSARQLSFGWVRRPEKRKPAEQARLDAIRGASAELARALDLADGFTDLIRKQSRETLDTWLVRAEASSCPEMCEFAKGIRQDESAVRAAMTEKWSNGPVEGHVNRLKTIKRQMYGRAGFVLLCARVRNAA